MADTDQVDRDIKGAPPPGSAYPAQSTSPIITATSPADTPIPSILADPLASLPSSPPQIYLNLLILEASLRAQWLQLRTRRRQHTFFLTLLGLWTIYFGYALFLAPREDGSGVGGSVYWVVEMAEKVCFMGGMITGILVWGTGQWERGIRWPRRWVYNTNRGLRGFNCKLVVIKHSWWRELLDALSFIFSYGLFSNSTGSSYRYVEQSLLLESEKTQRTGGHHALPNIHEDDDTAGYEEDLAPGGDCVKLLLLPKPFSPNFRENWDIYRTEYWEKENERRATISKVVKARDRKLAKKEGGWLWWTGYRGWKQGKAQDIEKTHHAHGAHKHGLLEKDAKRNRSGSIRSGSHSRNSSRSTTPTLEVDDPSAGGARGHVRRGSSASTSERRKKKIPATARLAPPGPRGATPDVPSPLVRGNSVSSRDSERPQTPGSEGDGGNLRTSKGARDGSFGRKSSGASRPGS